MRLRLTKLIISMGFWVCYRLWSFFRSMGRNELPGRCVILCYHEVIPSHRKRFAKQMDKLINSAKPIRADNIASLQRGVHYVAVTFDDGFQSFVENAIPELIIRDIPSTVFIPTGYIGHNPKWAIEPGYNISHERIVTEKQIRELPSNLVCIGSHSVTHTRLTLLQENEAKKELCQSRLKLESVSGRDVRLFSFPYGDYNRNLLKLAREAGYNRVFVSLPTVALMDLNEYVTGRVSANANDWQIEFILKLSGAYSWLPFASFLKRKLGLKKL